MTGFDAVPDLPEFQSRPTPSGEWATVELEGRTVAVHGERPLSGESGDRLPPGVESVVPVCLAFLERTGVQVDHDVLQTHVRAHGLPASLDGLVRLLRAFAPGASRDTGRSIEDLALYVERDDVVAAIVDVGAIGGDPASGARTCVIVTGVARERDAAGPCLGFAVRAAGDELGWFVDSETMAAAWLDAGGAVIVAGGRL